MLCFMLTVTPNIGKHMKNISIALLTAISLFSGSASASLTKVDWKTDGDGLAVLDTQSGVEWLNLKETQGLSIVQVEDLLSTTYLGWRIPTIYDIDILMSNHFTRAHLSDLSKVPYTKITTISVSSRNFILNFGATLESASLFSQGAHYLYDNETYSHSRVYYGSGDDYFYKGSYGTTSPVSYSGVFLISDGGVTLSSINDPSININNANSPYSTLASDVNSTGYFGFIALGLLAASGIRRGKV